MVDVAIAGNDGLVFKFQDGDVERVRSVITASPEQSPISGSAPANTLLFDFEGVVKVIYVEGALTDASTTRTYTSGGSPAGSVKTKREQKEWLEKQLNGSQAIKEFESNYEQAGTFNGSSFGDTLCMIQSVEFEEEAGNPEELPFRMVLVVGGGS